MLREHESIPYSRKNSSVLLVWKLMSRDALDDQTQTQSGKGACIALDPSSVDFNMQEDNRIMTHVQLYKHQGGC